jgi:hypothetical protein
MQDVELNSMDGKQLSEQELNWSSLGVHTYIKIALLAAAIYSVFHLEIYSIVSKWVTDSSWSHGFIIPLFSLYFVNQQKKELLTIVPKANWLGLVFLLCCLAFYVMVVYFYKFGYFKSVVIIPVIGSIILLIGGWRLVKYL